MELEAINFGPLIFFSCMNVFVSKSPQMIQGVLME